MAIRDSLLVEYLKYNRECARDKQKPNEYTTAYSDGIFDLYNAITRILQFSDDTIITKEQDKLKLEDVPSS